MLEKDVEKKLHTGVKGLKHGALCLKFVSPGFTGVPDRIILLPHCLHQPEKHEEPETRIEFLT